MLKLKHKSLTMLSGAIWMVIGCSLLTVGLELLMAAAKDPVAEAYPAMNLLSALFEGKEQAAILLITVGLFLGYFKGRYVLGKAARRVVQRIKNLPNPCSFFKIYGLPYYALIACMILLGMSFNYFGIPKDIRGTIDVAIGAALVNGAMIYFRIGTEMKAEKISKETP